MKRPGVTFGQAKKGQRYHSPNSKKFSMEDVVLTQPGYGLEGGWESKAPRKKFSMEDVVLTQPGYGLEGGRDSKKFSKQPVKTKKLSDDKASAFQSLLNRLKNVN